MVTDIPIVAQSRAAWEGASACFWRAHHGPMNIDLRGKVAFVLVGCVCYRSPVDPKTAPLHETKFIYRLGEPEPSGGMQPFVQPFGTAATLRLFEFPEGFSAD